MVLETELFSSIGVDGSAIKFCSSLKFFIIWLSHRDFFRQKTAQEIW